MLNKVKLRMNKIAIYVRVSTDEQAKNGFSVPSQRGVLEEVITKFGIGDESNTRYYIDDGYTGVNMNRPAFQRLLNDIKKGIVNLVMTLDEDRAGRESEYSSFWLKFLRAYNCECYIHNNPSLDIYTDAGVLQYQLKSAFSEYEVKAILRRTQAGILRSFLEGNYASPGTPYGYTKENRKLFIKEEEAKVVRLIHDLYIKEDMSLVSVRKYLNIHKINNEYWGQYRVSKILSNLVYIGTVVRNDLGRVFKELVPTIVSNEMKQMAITKLSLKSRNTIKSTKHIYKNLVICSECNIICINDTHHRGTTGKVYRYYHCKGCNKRINERIIDDLIQDTMLEIMISNISISAQKKIRRKILFFRKEQLAIEELYNANLLKKREYKSAMRELRENRILYICKQEDLYLTTFLWEHLSIKKKQIMIRKHISQISINLNRSILVELSLKNKKTV